MFPRGTQVCIFDFFSSCAYIFFFFFFWRCSMQDLSSQPGIEPRPPALEVQNLNHWNAREVTVFFK